MCWERLTGQSGHVVAPATPHLTLNLGLRYELTTESCRFSLIQAPNITPWQVFNLTGLLSFDRRRSDCYHDQLSQDSVCIETRLPKFANFIAFGLGPDFRSVIGLITRAGRHFAGAIRNRR